MKPKFQLRIQVRFSVHANNKTEAAMERKFTNQKNQQLKKAVQYCMESNIREYKALHSFFIINQSRETINHRLDGRIITGQ